MRSVLPSMASSLANGSGRPPTPAAGFCNWAVLVDGVRALDPYYAVSSNYVHMQLLVIVAGAGSSVSGKAFDTMSYFARTNNGKGTR